MLHPPEPQLCVWHSRSSPLPGVRRWMQRRFHPASFPADSAAVCSSRANSQCVAWAPPRCSRCADARMKRRLLLRRRDVGATAHTGHQLGGIAADLAEHLDSLADRIDPDRLVRIFSVAQMNNDAASVEHRVKVASRTRCRLGRVQEHLERAAALRAHPVMRSKQQIGPRGGEDQHERLPRHFHVERTVHDFFERIASGLGCASTRNVCPT
jgi:hypothetical protein